MADNLPIIINGVTYAGLVIANPGSGGGGGGGAVTAALGSYAAGALVQLPTNLGPVTSANSLSVTPATNATFAITAAALPLPAGAAQDATITTMSGKLPAALGPQAAAASFSIVPATGASFAVTGTFWQATQPVSAAALPLPAGASTEATLAAFSTATHADLIAATPAGTNIIGKVGIDQTTPGTTNAVVATGNVASAGADSGNPIKTGGVFLTTQATVTNGQRVDAQYTSRGEALVSISQGATAVTVANFSADAQAGPNSLAVRALGSAFNGTTWDRVRKPSGKSRIASTAASGSPTVAKASAADAGTFWGQNGAAITYLQFYDQTATPVIGTSTIIATYPIAANAAFSAPAGFAGTYWGTGLAYAFTTDAAGTTAAAGAAVTSFLLTYA